MPISIPKAIEILTPLTIPPGTCPDPDINDSIKLGIQALKRCQENRTAHRDHLGQLLPGETKD